MSDLLISTGDFIIEKRGLLRDTYRISKKLGSGAFGSVRKLIHRTTGEARAVKTINKKSLRTEAELQTFFNEVSVLRAIDHPNVLKLYEFYQDDKNFYLITEFCSGGELFDRIIQNGYFSESQAARYMRQILSVVAYCHERRIVHRDLKPENFLLDSITDDANLKVIDFGTAQFFTGGEQMRQKYGTAYYIAPEVLRRSYDQACDMWSAGVNLYIMLSGFPPFGGQTDEQILKKVAGGRYSFPSPEWDLISYEAKDLVSKMLTLDPARRITAAEALQHPWLHNASKVVINTGNSKALFRNLKNFRAERILQKATLSYIISQIVTKEEKEEMLELFKSLDRDSSGTLNKAELVEGFHLILGDIMEDVESEVESIIAQVDVNGSGEIDYSEFVLATMNRHKLLSREKLNSAFKAFDMDNNGTISADELKSVLGRHHNYDDQVWAELVREADTNGDGVIDLKEFTAMMLAMN